MMGGLISVGVSVDFSVVLLQSGSVEIFYVDARVAHQSCLKRDRAIHELAYAT